MARRTRGWGVLQAIAALALGIAGCPEDKKRPIGATCGGDEECTSGLCYEQVCIDPAADEDGDGLVNGFEVGLGADPYNVDSDLDGRPDGAEVPQGFAVDGDGDGKPDIIESALDDADGDCTVDERDVDDADGPSGFIDKTCRKTGVCAGATGDISLACEEGAPVGTCVYDAVPGWDAQDDDCDGADSDCDGETDEGCGVVVSSCDGLYREDPSRESGVYSVDPDGDGPEPATEVECAMGPGGGGWARLGSGWRAVLERQGARWRQYLFVGPSGWVMSPATEAVWSWSSGVAVAGTWFAGGDELTAFWCEGAAEDATIGIGCFARDGAYATGEAVDEAGGSARVCGAGGGVFGNCAEAAIYVRDVRCPAEVGLVGDGEFEGLASGGPTCWTIESLDPQGGGGGLGANVYVDVEGAREGGAPAIRAEPFHPTEGFPWQVWLSHGELGLAAGSSYTLSFWAKAAVPRILLVDMGEVAGGFAEYTFVDEVWRRYDIDFVAAETTLEGAVRFYLGLAEDEAVVWLDGIELVETGPDACAKVAPELVGDGGFGRGLACWTRAASTEDHHGVLARDADAPNEAPSLRAEQGATPDGSTPFISQGELAFESGRLYRLSYMAKAAAPRNMEVTLIGDNAEAVAIQVERGLGVGWGRGVVRFWTDPAKGAPGAGTLLFLFAQGGTETVWLDDVSIVDLGTEPCARDGGLLADPGFDLGGRCWSFVTAAGTALEVVQEDDGSGSAPYLLARNVSGTAIEGLGIFQPGVALEVGAYEVSFRAKTDFAPRSLRVRVKASDRAATALVAQTVDVTEGWTRHVVAFDSPRVDANAVLQIDLGGASAAYLRLDDLEIIKIAR